MDIKKLNDELNNPALIEVERDKSTIAGIDHALAQYGITKTGIQLPDIKMPNDDNRVLTALELSANAASNAAKDPTLLAPSAGFDIALGTPRLTPQGTTIPSTADDWTSPNCTRSTEQHCTRYITNQNIKNIKDNLSNLGVSYTTDSGATFSLTGTPKNPTASVNFTKRF